MPFDFYRQDGLMQSDQAADLRDVLAAVASPQPTAKRLRAFATPWFGVPWAQLPFYRVLPADHPLLRRLYRWRARAEQGIAALFDAMLAGSGVVERGLYLDGDERGLTNQRHLLEVLLEAAVAERLTLEAVAERLDRYVRGLEAPEGSDANVQRLAAERDAVQVMTIHRAKGLEAPVVCLYGGFRAPPTGGVRAVHDGLGRHVLVGADAREAVADQLAVDAQQEDQRLYYVALTRAAARLYLPLVDSSRQIKGGYAALNARLQAMDHAGFETVQLPPLEGRAPRPFAAGVGAPLGGWVPAEPRTARGVDYEGLRERHAPWVVTSYTRLKSAEAPEVDGEPLYTPIDAPEIDPEALPGGRHMGRFLHEAIEEVPFELYAAPYAAWRELKVVGAAFDDAMRRHDIEPRWRDRALRVVYDTLTAPVALGGSQIDGLWRCADPVVEMELLFPIPEAQHPLLDGRAGDDFSAERGFVKGFIDLVFSHRGRLYFADWKSDTLGGYAPAELDAHVDGHYGLQAQLYTLGLVRLLDVRDEAAYERLFGGLLYVFLRGMGVPGEGVYFERPSWSDVVGWEQGLLQRVI